MSLLYLIYKEVFYEPLLNGLVFFIGVLPGNDAGFAVIVLTLLVKIIIFPLTHRSVKTQAKIKQIEPELKKIKETINDRRKQAEEMLKIYREHGISPYSGILMLFVQLPILIALYSVFWKGFSFDHDLYSFLVVPDNINLKFLGLFDITQKSVFLAVLTGITQFLQVKFAFPPRNKNGAKSDFNSILATQMKYFMPIFIFIIALKLPAAVSLYWTTMNIFAILHEAIVRKKHERKL